VLGVEGAAQRGDRLVERLGAQLGVRRLERRRALQSRQDLLRRLGGRAARVVPRGADRQAGRPWRGAGGK
jgi:hypothetical protein